MDTVSLHISQSEFLFLDLESAIDPYSQRNNNENKNHLTIREAIHIGAEFKTILKIIHAIITSAAHIPFRDSKITRLLTVSVFGVTTITA